MYMNRLGMLVCVGLHAAAAIVHKNFKYIYTYVHMYMSVYMIISVYSLKMRTAFANLKLQTLHKKPSHTHTHSVSVLCFVFVLANASLI